MPVLTQIPTQQKPALNGATSVADYQQVTMTDNTGSAVVSAPPVTSGLILGMPKGEFWAIAGSIVGVVLTLAIVHHFTKAK